MDDDDFLMFDDDDGTVEDMPEDGRTEYGKLEATRPCRTGNVRFDRHIVNAGADNRPFYKVIKGYDLGPGGAEALHDHEEEKLHTKFDVFVRKASIKKSCTIKMLGPCVEMTKLTKSGKPYRLDLYVRVVSHRSSEKSRCEEASDR